jgi:hypothetical protein
MINRAAVILKYKNLAVKWINEADPFPDSSTISAESVNQDRTVYLIRNEDADTPDDLNKWIKVNFKTIFENELEGWYTDEKLWPKKRNLKLFHEWFEVECHTILEDTVDMFIGEDET